MRDKRANARNADATRALGERTAGEKLEIQLRAELQDTRVAEGGHRTKSRTIDQDPWRYAARLIRDRSADAEISKIRVIENVEGLSSELKANVFAEPKTLGHREVDPLGWRTINGASRGVPRNIRNARRAGRSLQGEASPVEPLVDGMGRVCVWIAQEHGPTSGYDGRNKAEPGSIVAGAGNVEGKARVVSDNTRCLPASQDLSDETFLIAQEGQLIDVVRAQHVFPVKNRPAVFCPDVVRILRRSGDRRRLIVSQIL